MTTDDTRARILNAAGLIFADRGFQAATVRDICQKADVNLASVNYHFGDKQQLYIQAVRNAHQLLAGQVPMPDWPADATAESKLQDFIRTLITRMIGSQTAPWQTRLMMREILSPTSACKEMVEDYFRPHFELLLRILSELLPAETPDSARQQIGFSIVGQCLFYRVAGEVVGMLVDDKDRSADYSVDQLAEHIGRFSLAALSEIAGSTPNDVGQHVHQE